MYHIDRKHYPHATQSCACVGGGDCVVGGRRGNPTRTCEFGELHDLDVFLFSSLSVPPSHGEGCRVQSRDRCACGGAGLEPDLGGTHSLILQVPGTISQGYMACGRQACMATWAGWGRGHGCRPWGLWSGLGSGGVGSWGGGAGQGRWGMQCMGGFGGDCEGESERVSMSECVRVGERVCVDVDVGGMPSLCVPTMCP